MNYAVSSVNSEEIMRSYKVEDYRAYGTSAILGNGKYHDRAGSDPAAHGNPY